VFLTDGGQTAESIASLLGGFIGQARTSLEIAIYDVKLDGPARDLVLKSLQDALARGVRLRIVFNQDYGGQRAAPPPPEMSDWPFIKDLPRETWFPVNGDPDLMHHKYVVCDSASVWTGSANWTNDSWTREENVILRVDAPELAAVYRANFENLWTWRQVQVSGRQRPEWFDLGTGVAARPYFTPGRAEKLVHELSQRIATARRRVRICSPVMTSGPVLGTLADIVQRGFEGIDIKGVFDATQMAEVRHQWSQNTQASWKLSALAAILAGIPFSGKVSTPWATGTVHDFMHAKCLVADDYVFCGSYNLSHSGEMNAENVIEFQDAGLADLFAGYIDRVIARYPPAVAA
jgi:phosphatidylserine/phosphatidylglycerophosphate/cardiolipin synthase-like enzyme